MGVHQALISGSKSSLASTSCGAVINESSQSETAIASRHLGNTSRRRNVHAIQNVLVVGVGSGGKATAADLALQGKRVRLFAFPDHASGLTPSMYQDKTLRVKGAMEGCAKLEMVTMDIRQAMQGDIDTIFIATVVMAHEALAHLLAPFVQPHHLVVLNPGSTGGCLHLARIWRDDYNMEQLPTLVEFGTLAYACRAWQDEVFVAVKLQYLEFSAFPATKMDDVTAPLKELFPGLVPFPSVLASGLCNTNPAIHPAITLLNIGRLESQLQDSKLLFYRDGCTPMVARLLEGLDRERLSIMQAFGYAQCAISDPQASVLQGYTERDGSYHDCYQGKVYGEFTSPNCDLASHRYFQEDIGHGLVLLHSLGESLGLATPLIDSVIAIASCIARTDYLKEARRTVHTLGLQGLTKAQILEYVETGMFPSRSQCLRTAPGVEQPCPEQPETPMRAGNREAIGTCFRLCVEDADGMDLGCG